MAEQTVLKTAPATLWRIAGLPHPGAEAMAYMH